MPKFDNVIVAPRSSSGGIARAAASARMRSSPDRKSERSRSPTLRRTGTMRPPSRSTAIPTSTRLASFSQFRVVPNVQGRLRFAGRRNSLHQADGYVRVFRPGVDLDFVGYRCRNDLSVRQRKATRCALNVDPRDHATRPAALHQAEVDIQFTRQRPDRGEHLQTTRPCAAPLRVSYLSGALRGPLPHCYTSNSFKKSLAAIDGRLPHGVYRLPGTSLIDSMSRCRSSPATRAKRSQHELDFRSRKLP